MKAKHSKDESFIRILFMLLFAVVLNISISVVMLIGFLQWLIRMIRHDEIIRLKEFSSSLNEFNYQIGQFLTLNEEKKPFPFSDWPEPEMKGVSEAEFDADINNESTQKKESDNPGEKSNLQEMQNSELSSNASILDQDLTDDEQFDSMKESDS
ncbi:MAG: DUF4389 domain-containing protein [Saccharospirillaceae bacterium]|nr:DUF4389 domain-containing protein [Pseudomonadales bacterium]NRB80226.1 DUF4389 domain-containing protein [Saccharospirillaceae bacterium]